MPASAFLLGASAATRVASLNLCTDEYVLLLARPEQVASVSYLSHDPLESSLWRSARRYRSNRGSIEDVLTLRPTLVLTMGGGGRATRLLAAHLHMRALDLPYAATLGDVEQNLRKVAAALGDARRADGWIARIETLRRSAPRQATDSIWVSGRGDSLAAQSLGAEWLTLAGFRQRSLSGGQVTLETLLISPPKVLIKSNYRSGEMSGGAQWLDHPIVRHAGARQIVTDGRPWTCVGPLMIPEIERLRKLAR
jgi:iron complex transport system substrate-binding protein